MISDIDSFRVLLNAESVTVDSNYEPEGMVPSGAGIFGLIYMPLAGIIDKEAETARLTKQKNELEKENYNLDHYIFSNDLSCLVWD